jgi:preprotein translocase subunit SecA
MALLTNILTRFFGNKSERDIREIAPILELIKDEYKKIVELSYKYSTGNIKSYS